ncbi:MAG: BamA/TamA family outer membrane protein [Candidatus Neomarinimicrobiota bacterium]
MMKFSLTKRFLRAAMTEKTVLFSITVFVIFMNRLWAGIPQDSTYFGDIRIESEREMTTEQVGQIRKEFYDVKADTTGFKRLTDAMLSIPISEGYYFSIVEMTNVAPLEKAGKIYLNPLFRIGWGEQVRIDTFYFEGNEKTSSRLLSRETQRFQKMVWSESMNRAIRTSFRKYPFLEITSQPEVVRTKEGVYGLVVNMQEKPDNRFTGVIGYVPEKNDQKGYFTGQIDLKIQNLSGTGRRISIYWSKINQYSQELYVTYAEPWIWKTSLFGEGEFQQVLRDTVLVTRQIELGIGRYLTNGDLQVKFGRESTLPTLSGRTTLGLTSAKTTSLGLQLSTDRRDKPLNPTRGFHLKAEGSIGDRKLEDVRHRVQYQSEITAECVFPVYRPWVASIGGQYAGKWISSGQLTYADQFWFGGAKSLRGYSDDFFHGTEIGWLSFEIRWLIGNLSRVYVFFDQGYYKMAQKSPAEQGFPSSFGVGMRLESRMGVIGIDYGFGEKDTFSTAKIHVFLENQF